jgi:hypothetical protein
MLLPYLDMTSGVVLRMTLRFHPVPDSLTEHLRAWSGLGQTLACTPEGRTFLEQCCDDGSPEDPFSALVNVRDELTDIEHRAKEEVRQAYAEMSRFKAAYEEVLASWSWRLMAPFRWIWGWVLAARRAFRWTSR